MSGRPYPSSPSLAPKTSIVGSVALGSAWATQGWDGSSGQVPDPYGAGPCAARLPQVRLAGSPPAEVAPARPDTGPDVNVQVPGPPAQAHWATEAVPSMKMVMPPLAAQVEVLPEDPASGDGTPGARPTELETPPAEETATGFAHWQHGEVPEGQEVPRAQTAFAAEAADPDATRTVLEPTRFPPQYWAQDHACCEAGGGGFTVEAEEDPLPPHESSPRTPASERLLANGRARTWPSSFLFRPRLSREARPRASPGRASPQGASARGPGRRGGPRLGVPGRSPRRSDTMSPMRLGLLADTHGLVDPKLAEVFRGCELLIHAGDVTRPEVLKALAAIAPVRAVRGNNDVGPFGESLPEVGRVALEGLRALVVHEAHPDRPSPWLRRLLEEEPADLVVHGHSHRPGVSAQGRLLYLNPGSAGPRRFSLPRTACVATVLGRHLSVHFWDLSPETPIHYGQPLERDL